MLFVSFFVASLHSVSILKPKDVEGAKKLLRTAYSQPLEAQMADESESIARMAATCGVGALPSAYELTALAKIELSSAVPIEPPTCCIVFTIAEATPVSLGATP